MKDFKKEFESRFHKLAMKYSSWQVWNDFLCMTAASMANVIPTPEREAREQEYLRIVKKYQKEELDIFSELFGIVVLSLEENQEQDFLGEMYVRLNLYQEQKGQFFTPYHISQFMVEITSNEEDVKEQIQKKGHLQVCDPTCGSGVMLIAYANYMKNLQIPYQQKVLFWAQDIDRTAALMCYIQLSLLGCPAVVIVGDSLVKPGVHPENEVWLSPFYYLNAWRFEQSRQEEASSPVMMIPSGRGMYVEDEKGQIKLDLGALLSEDAA